MTYSIRDGRYVYELHGSGTKWRFERWEDEDDEADGWLVQSGRWPLDYDKRHRRLFLSDRDERRVGVAGIAALERLARRALGERGRASER